MYTYMYTLYVSQCLPRVFKMARWIGRVGGYQRPGNDKELRWSLWPSVWSGPLLMTIVDQDATISHLFTGLFWLLPQTRAGNGYFRFSKWTRKLPTPINPVFFFKSSLKKNTNFRGIACTAALLMSGNPGYVCWGWFVASRHQPRRLTSLPRQGEPVVKSKLKPCEGGVREPFSCEGLGKPRGFCGIFFWIWHVTMLQFCKKAVIWLMLVLDDLGDDFTWREG